MAHGKSKSVENPNGVRSRVQSFGLELAPKALRKRGKLWMTSCTDEELERISQVTRKSP